MCTWHDTPGLEWTSVFSQLRWSLRREKEGGELDCGVCEGARRHGDRDDGGNPEWRRASPTRSPGESQSAGWQRSLGSGKGAGGGGERARAPQRGGGGRQTWRKGTPSTCREDGRARTHKPAAHLDLWGGAELRRSVEQGASCLGLAEAGCRGAGRVHRKWHQEAGSPCVVP